MSYIYPTEPFVQYGWMCPNCRNVMSPTMSFCLFCSNKAKQEAKPSTGTGAPLPEPTITTSSTFPNTRFSESTTFTFKNENYNSRIKKPKRS